MKKILLALALLHGSALYAVESYAHQYTGLQTPESVVQAKDGTIYVSEINGFGKDGDGRIRMLSHGKASVLVDGLDDPKGLTIIGNNLYIADKTKVLKVALNEKPARATVFVPASAFTHPPQFLNDIQAGPHGNLFISDSGDIMGSGKGGSIYEISAQGQVTLLIDGQQDPRVLAPNGIIVDDTGDNIIYVDFTSGVLYQYNKVNKTLVDVSDANFGGGDGVAHRSDGTMYVSDWKTGKVYSISTKGDVTTLKQGYQSAADIAITQDEKYLMVPDMKAGILDFIPLK